MNYDIVHILFAAVAVLLGITFHEFSHAFVATRLGDPTPRMLGRVTLNPVAHFDLFGGFLVLLTLFNLSPIGYGKPVQVNPHNFTDGRQGMMWVSFAGPAANLLLAILFSLLLNLPVSALAVKLFSIIIQVNVFLALFNLLPISPLDGEKILEAFVPYEYLEAFRRFQQQYGLFLFILIIFWGYRIIVPIAQFILSLLTLLIFR